MKKLLISFAVIAIGLWLFLSESQKTADQLYADNPHVRAVAPGQDRTAGFLTLINPTDNACKLISATADIADRVEFHSHQHIDNMVMMRPVDSIHVPATSDVALQPGGLHLMLFGVQPSAAKNTQINIETDQCGTLSFSAPIMAIGAAHKEAMHH